MNQNAQCFQSYCKQMMHILDFAVFICNADLPRVNLEQIAI